jgi:hypothetical protein
MVCQTCACWRPALTKQERCKWILTRVLPIGIIYIRNFINLWIPLSGPRFMFGHHSALLQAGFQYKLPWFRHQGTVPKAAWFQMISRKPQVSLHTKNNTIGGRRNYMTRFRGCYWSQGLQKLRTCMRFLPGRSAEKRPPAVVIVAAPVSGFRDLEKLKRRSCVGVLAMPLSWTQERKFFLYSAERRKGYVILIHFCVFLVACGVDVEN